MASVDRDEAAARLAEVHERIARAAALAGRSAREITLIAVTKTFGADAILPLLEAGHRAFGENRVQEAAAKWPPLIERYPDIELHLIGQLQSNKAAEAARLFASIHSLDRPSLLSALARAEMRRPVFVQVNIGAEAQKGGCPIAETGALVADAQAAGLEVRGLMCVPPAAVEPAPYFALLAKMRGELGLPALSMGMSSDFETAVMLGATHVRVGSALFGSRV
ncbi:MAG: YggS family pyridoxal phosphate-dependent enzyme [Sphingomonadaceae bacterium]|nr:YggS family pyridoxal phosphate-dependent enzyme [Sphingomonadaceae bacterium]